MLKRLPDNRTALTFDDGPDPDLTPRVLDILARHRVLATFFVLGEMAERDPALVRRIVAEGHTLGSHGYRHRRPARLDRTEQEDDMARSVQVLWDIAGVRLRWYRPPHGNAPPGLEALARAMKLEMVLWSRSAIDWGPLGTRRGIARRLGRVRAGDIVLLHDGRRRINRPGNTVAVLPPFLAGLTTRGLAPVSLDQTLASTGTGIPPAGEADGFTD